MGCLGFFYLKIVENDYIYIHLYLLLIYFNQHIFINSYTILDSLVFNIILLRNRY